ncbi:hypothetical protein CSB20_07355, partial [bacterium DOLZORAL124_64_63]
NASAQVIYEIYDEGNVSFDWSAWPFGYPSGSEAMEGPFWNEEFIFPGDATEGCGGILKPGEGESTQAVALGGVDNGDGTYDVVAIMVTFPGEPAVGTYEVDATNGSVGFAFIDNVSNLSIPEDGANLMEWFENLEATNRFGSTSGEVVVTAASDESFEGTFSGLLADPETLELRNVENGVFSVVDVPVSAVPTTPGRAHLAAAPNPFNPQTTIALSLKHPERVGVAVYDMAGHQVARLHQGNLDAGDHRWVWSGRNDAGRRQPAGMYFCRAAGSGWSRVTKLVLVP